MEYQAQLAAKRQQIIDAIERIAKLPDVIIHDPISAKDSWYYRNKMQFSVGLAGSKVAIGCFAAGTHAIVDTDNCYIQHVLNNKLIEVCRQLISKLNISVYDEHTGQGLLRHIMGRVGQVTGEVMLVLVTASVKIPAEEKFIVGLTAQFPGLVSIIQNINSAKTNIILGDTCKTLWGKTTIIDKLGSLEFCISAKSFFQVNTQQANLLYNKVMDYADLTGTETVIDAYCGTGTISLFLAQKARKESMASSWLKPQSPMPTQTRRTTT